jgi:predicted nucleic acid-binding protein
MILLDTNVISAVMSPRPPVTVLTWLNHNESETLFLSTITIAEIMYGLRAMPEGKRQVALSCRFDEFLERGFRHRILDFDLDAAAEFAEIMANRRRMGRPMSLPDGQIAAIARAHGMAAATRNVRDFESCGIKIINPFER